jgi:hypothetical protein
MLIGITRDDLTDKDKILPFNLLLDTPGCHAALARYDDGFERLE